MAKIQLKGIIKEVSPINTIGINNAKHQSMLLLVPGFVDSYGEKRAKDEFWLINVVGDKVDQFNLSAMNLIDTKADVVAYINSSLARKDGAVRHFLNANLASLELRKN